MTDEERTAAAASRRQEREQIVRWILERAEEYSYPVRATVLRFVRRIEAGEHWRLP
jgi:hypothetical protein